MIPIEHFFILSSILFCIGIAILITKRNAIVALMGIELMLNAANINLVAFSRWDAHISGQLFALFVMVIAAAEAAVALAIIMLVYHHYHSANLDEIKDLKG